MNRRPTIVSFTGVFDSGKTSIMKVLSEYLKNDYAVQEGYVTLEKKSLDEGIQNISSPTEFARLWSNYKESFEMTMKHAMEIDADYVVLDSCVFDPIPYMQIVNSLNFDDLKRQEHKIMSFLSENPVDYIIFCEPIRGLFKSEEERKKQVKTSMKFLELLDTLKFHILYNKPVISRLSDVVHIIAPKNT